MPSVLICGFFLSLLPDFTGGGRLFLKQYMLFAEHLSKGFKKVFL